MAKQAQLDAVRPVLTDIDKGVTVVEKALDAVEAGTDTATDILESGLEKVADVVPEAIDKGVTATAEVTRKGAQAFRNPRTVAIVVIGASMAAGAGLGYLGYRLMKKRLEKQYEERMEIQLEEMRNFYLKRNKTGKYATPETAAEALRGDDAVVAMDEYQNGKRTKDKAEPRRPVEYNKIKTSDEAREEMRDHVVQIEETVERNVFVDGQPIVDDEWDMEAEEASRDRSAPYVISHDEFMANEFEHPQNSLTYYEGDEILADEQDNAIQDSDTLVGDLNLTRFGHGSRDPNVVYVRNELMEVEFEITRSPGKFAEEVMGLRHSDDLPRLRRARWGDDE
jgi:hypothetical protein